MPRYFCIEVERRVTYRRKVWVEVEESAERIEDAKQYENLFVDEAKDAAREKAKTCTLTGWEPFGEPEYWAVSAQKVESAPNVDVMI